MIRYLDHGAARINPVLLIAAMCLLVLDLSFFAAIEISRLPARQSAVEPTHSPADGRAE